MKKHIGVISNTAEIAARYAQELLELFGDYAEVDYFSLEGKTIHSLFDCDLYLVASTAYDLMQNDWVRSLLPPESKIVQSEVTFTKEIVESLKAYPQGTRAMLVNQNQHMAVECIAQLYHLGVSNIRFFPCYPEIAQVPDLDLAFAPGELCYVPDRATQVVDLGPRKFTLNVVSEIALKLGTHSLLEKKYEAYAESLAKVDYSLQALAAHNLTLENQLEVLFNELDTGIIAIDSQGIITVVNRAARRMLGLRQREMLGRPADQTLPSIPFGESLGTKEGKKNKLVRINEVDVGLTITPLQVRGNYLGAFALFQRFEDGEKQQNTLRLQMLHKGYQARYTFDDIIGSSLAISQTRQIARRMACNNASVLLEGESGTGKELFAQAIHNESPRREAPFLAINCAALPENLLESELFGYTEGAFTGANKKGKLGLFEYAHRGTIFLDEIESMSPSLQAKLLRVLEEKEIMRIGATQPIAVDVRVISASNEDLFSQVQQGHFRHDLYYRLNVVPIRIPPLRERVEDISVLVRHFQHEMGGSFVLAPRTKVAFRSHRWEGNVRELRNYVEYLCHMDFETVEPEDLPERFHRDIRHTAIPGMEAYANSVCSEKVHATPAEFTPQEWMVALLLQESGLRGKSLGRRALAQLSMDRGNPLTEREVRQAMDSLREKGYLSVGKGRKGCTLSETGHSAVKKAK